MKSKTKRRRRRAAIGLAVLCSLVGAALFIVPYATTGASWDSLRDGDSSSAAPAWADLNDADAMLIVMTANIAHGRGTARHQALLNRDEIRTNLDEIAMVFAREQPDVVALQEADGPSLWSGGFNQVDYLADVAEFPHRFLGEHMQGLKTSYGTALLSHMPLNDRGSITFSPSPPTLSKGYVVSRIGWPDSPGVEVTVVSVHLDFSRASVRKKQVAQMIRKLSQRERPLIIVGDFNCSWTGEEESLRTLADGLNVRAFDPTAAKMGTFPSSGRRLDWILISDELEFVRYETITDTVSDHRGVIAALKLSRSR